MYGDRMLSNENEKEKMMIIDQDTAVIEAITGGIIIVIIMVILITDAHLAAKVEGIAGSVDLANTSSKE